MKDTDSGFVVATLVISSNPFAEQMPVYQQAQYFHDIESAFDYISDLKMAEHARMYLG